jgi:hypothetical protein
MSSRFTLLAALALASATPALASDARAPTTTDEARALSETVPAGAAQPRRVAAVSTTDEARDVAGGTAAVAAASVAAPHEHGKAATCGCRS